MIKQVCVFCEKHLGTLEDGLDSNSNSISHGVCPNCLPKFMAGTGEDMVDFLDSLPGPVFVINKDGRVVSANTHGPLYLSTEVNAIQGRLGGEVFECKYAKSPGGCGHTICCKTCTIRKTVMQTAETGESHFRVPAYMDLGDICDTRTVKFLISTEKVNDVVLLRIDDAQPEELFEQPHNECSELLIEK